MEQPQIISTAKATQKKKAYTQIKDAICSFRFVANQMLKEEELARWLGISRTPLREALSALDREGLVKILPHRGAFVCEISYEEILQIFVVREALEGLAARLSTPNIPAAEIERLYEKTKFYASEDQIDTDKLLALDVPLHSLILDYCGNETLQRFLKDMTDRINRVRMRSTVVTSRFHKSVEELLAIIEAIRARNPDQAEILMKEHIRHAKENTLTALSIPMPNLMMKE